MIKVPINDISFCDSYYDHLNGSYKAQTLYDFAKAKDYPIMDMPLCFFDLSVYAFELKNLHDFIFQCNRVRSCSLDYPIILDNMGCVADGYHRICRAILLGKETVKAIRLLEMPAPDYPK